MTHKIYLIKHLDTGKGYVGITGDELGKRWYQHLHDKNGALYTALRAEGHRMTMELIEEVATREAALIKEQEYIHALGTAQPFGWNRDVRPLKVEEPEPLALPKVWERFTAGLATGHSYGLGQTIACHSCGADNLHQKTVEVYQCDEDSAGICTVASLTETTITTIGRHTKNNPSSRRNGLRIFFECEHCHHDHGGYDENGEELFVETPPLFELTIAQHKGNTITEFVYYQEKQQ